MKPLPLALLLLTGFCGGVLGKPPSVTPEGGFALNASDKSSTAAFGRFLSAGEKLFRELTGFPPSAHPPVLVVLHLPAENLPSLPSLSVDAVEGGVPRIVVHLRSGEQGADATQLLAAALMLREYYRDHAPVPGSPVPRFPPWVIRGMATLCFPPDEPVRIPSVYLKGGSPPVLEDFLIQRPPDLSNPSLSDLYAATAAALLRSGLATAAGQAAFRKWIGHDDPFQPAGNPARWIEGWEMKPVERRWLLLMAGSSSEGNGTARLQTIPESLKSYDAVMAGGLTGGATIGSLAHDKKTGPFLLGKISDRLNGLRLRANPMAVPLIDRTVILIGKAPGLPPKKIAAEEKSLLELRQTILKQSAGIEAYLDWYEATQLPIRSGYFDRFLRNPGSEVRKGPVGRHIDAVEARGW